jgi:hypothetical protein
VPQSGYANHANAIRRRSHRVPEVVARRRHDDRADGIDLGDGIEIGLCARAFAAQAEIEHLRGIRIGRHTRHGEPRRPTHAGYDVRVEAAALAQHAHRQEMRTLRPTLAMPTPLLVSAPIRPLVCVPCHELFSAASAHSKNGPFAFWISA